MEIYSRDRRLMNNHRRQGNPMGQKKLDITGNISPYCLSVVAKEAKALKPSDELLITCDNFPAATTSIPRIAQDEDLAIEVQKYPKEHWEIRMRRE